MSVHIITQADVNNEETVDEEPATDETPATNQVTPMKQKAEKEDDEDDEDGSKHDDTENESESESVEAGNDAATKPTTRKRSPRKASSGKKNNAKKPKYGIILLQGKEGKFFKSTEQELEMDYISNECDGKPFKYFRCNLKKDAEKYVKDHQLNNYNQPKEKPETEEKITKETALPKQNNMPIAKVKTVQQHTTFFVNFLTQPFLLNLEQHFRR